MKYDSYDRLHQDLLANQSEEKAEKTKRFFKTNAGSYAAEDVFLGFTIPELRALEKEIEQQRFDLYKQLLQSKYHDERMIACIALTRLYKRKRKTVSDEMLHQFYLDNIDHIDNWDLVDTSAPWLIGDYLYRYKEIDRRLLDDLARRASLWHRRVAIVGTLGLVRQGEISDAVRVSQILLNATDDLIHKAVGWVLREVGKVNRTSLEDFLNRHWSQMPRTTLRYAIEKFDAAKRCEWLSKKT